MNIKRLLSLLFVTGSLFADTIYVNNNEAIPADYRTFQEAHDAASAGDTIILAASAISYGNISIQKRLTVRGNGFGDNQVVEMADSGVSRIGRLTIGSASDREIAAGSVVEGIYSIGGSLNGFSVDAHRCLITRSRIDDLWIYGNLTIVQSCNITDLGIDSPSTGTIIRNSRVLRSIDGPASFKNCILSFPGSSSNIPSSTIYEFDNCIFVNVSYFSTDDFLARNCLFLDGGDAPFGTNASSSTSAETFELTGSSASRYLVKAGAVAKTSATDGGEVGIFGGPTPYVRRALPPVPLIKSAALISADATTGLTFEVTAEARD